MLYRVEVCHFADEANFSEYHTYFETRAKTVNGIVRAANRALSKLYGMPMPVVATARDITIGKTRTYLA